MNDATNQKTQQINTAKIFKPTIIQQFEAQRKETAIKVNNEKLIQIQTEDMSQKQT